jgi:hypothetical protein
MNTTNAAFAATLATAFAATAFALAAGTYEAATTPQREIPVVKLEPVVITGTKARKAPVPVAALETVVITGSRRTQGGGTVAQAAGRQQPLMARQF